MSDFLAKEDCTNSVQTYLKIEDVEDLSGIISKQDIYIVVEQNLKTTDYILKSFEVANIGTVSGFLGEYYKINIKIIYKNQETTINAFVKSMPKSRESKEIIEDSNGFWKEVFVYQTLVPKFHEYGINTINDCLPTCYLQRPNDILVLEDLNILDFKNIPTQNPYDFDTLCVVLKKVAKFHASAFIYEEKMSEKLGKSYRLNEEYKDFFKESLIVDDGNHSGGKFVVNGVRGILQAIELFPELKTEENSKNFEKFWPKLKKIFYSTINASEKFRNVVSHGDLWSSNILLKSEGDKVIDCRFVDYQLIRYCPPAHDLLSVLHLTTIRSTRLKHEEELKRVYYNELGFHLQKFNYDVKKVLPYRDFQGGIELMKPQMLIQSTIYAMLSMCTSEQISSMLLDPEESKRVFFEDRKEFIQKMCNVSEVYKSRLREQVLDIYEYCTFLGGQ